MSERDAIIRALENDKFRVLFVRRFVKYGYEFRREQYCFIEPSLNTVIMESAYSLDGDYIGPSSSARFLARKMGIRHFEKRTKDSNICSVGYDPKKCKWYGWSHRAIFGYAVGDKHKRKTIKTLSEARRAARSFAASVA